MWIIIPVRDNAGPGARCQCCPGDAGEYGVIRCDSALRKEGSDGGRVGGRADGAKVHSRVGGTAAAAGAEVEQNC